MLNHSPQTTLSVILPCRNEEKTLGACLEQIKSVLARHNLAGEIIVSDSSTDRSPEIAHQHGVKLIKHDRVGYGIAYQEGIKAASGRYLIMADADGTYDFNDIPRFIEQLESGADFVIGNRFAGTIQPGAMPLLHRYLGNPILSGLVRWLFHIKVHDVHCGMRAISRQAFDQIRPKTTGMEFASEMIIAAARRHLKIAELPINYARRQGNSKLKTFSDGWRHLRFILLYSPLLLFFLPGSLLCVVGIAFFLLIFNEKLSLGGAPFQYHPLFAAALLILVGYQLIIFSAFAKTYAMTHLGDDSRLMNRLYRFVTIERASVVGGIITLLGGLLYGRIVWQWVATGFGELHEIKTAITALTLAVVGIQTITAAFMLSILGIKER